MNQNPAAPEEPRRKREFVGMMFAVTVGEVGLQVAPLVRAGHWVQFLPASSHLFLAFVVIATSWVGWTQSAAPGALKDVTSVFQWEFLVLLLDVALVITYFILVRTVHFEKDQTFPTPDSSSTVAFWVFVIFCQYFLWDFLTKVIIHWEGSGRRKQWLHDSGSRMGPTILCGLLSLVLWRFVEAKDSPHYLTQDFALLWLILLFRALKDLVSAWFPKETLSFVKAKTASKVWACMCLAMMVLGIAWTTCSWPLPERIATEITKPKPVERLDAH